MLRLAWYELRRGAGPLRRLAPVALVLIPTLCGALILWSTWDPYGRLGQVPVAVVNADQPIRAGTGVEVNAGALFVDQLRHNRTFDWRFVDTSRAARGVRDGRYAFVITVPADFSARLASTAGGQPQRAGIQVVLNDANGYLVGKMAETAQPVLQNQIDTAAYTAYAKSMLGGLLDMRTQLTDAADGAGRVGAGAATAVTGANQLAAGLTQLRTAADQLAPATARLSEGAGQVAGAVSTGATVLTTDIPKLADDATASTGGVRQALGEASAATEQAAALTRKLDDDLKDLATRHPAIVDDAAYKRLLAAAAAANAAVGRIDVAHQRLDTAAQQVAARTTRIGARAREAGVQLRQTDEKVRTLAAGATQVATSATQIQQGIAQAQPSAAQLAAALPQLQAGTAQLAIGLRSGAERVPTLDPAERERAAAVLGSPVEVRTSNLNPAGVAGRGMAPFVFAVALWVFALIVYRRLRAVNPRALAGRVGSLAVAFGGWLPAAALGCAGALALYLVVDLGLGLDPVDVPATLGLLGLAAAAFVAVAHLLRLLFGRVGDLVTLVLLLLQVTACGGLYPVPTTPLPLRVLHPLVPMTYLVDGLRVTISGGPTAHLVRDVAVLGGLLAGVLAITVIITRRRRVWSVARLARLRSALAP